MLTGLKTKNGLLVYAQVGDLLIFDTKAKTLEFVRPGIGVGILWPSGREYLVLPWVNTLEDFRRTVDLVAEFAGLMASLDEKSAESGAWKARLISILPSAA